MKTRAARGGLASLALIAVLASCGQSIHTGIAGELAGTTAASTSLAVPASAVEVMLGGTLFLTAGSATVTLSPPAGPTTSFTVVHSAAPGVTETFVIGPYSAPRTSGVYGLSVAGDDVTAQGGYDLDLEAW